MPVSKPCPECDGTHLYVRDNIRTRGSYGPDLLPGASGIFSGARMKAVVCRDCGLIRFYASRETLARIDSDHGWKRLS